ncbi:DUF1203 domain-containing protein [Altererythrobacter sp.]|uniref:DUF1203 domain-containing protein n=1 Tax=Altererythrobacter sp. TaxID=1872480 RepID=UPI003D0341D3
MTYRIRGLEPGQFAQYFTLDETGLREHLAERHIASAEGRYPCRVSLQDADPGDNLILLHYENHSAPTPYRNAFAIYVRAEAREAAEFIDELPPVLRGRPISLRAFDHSGRLCGAVLALADDVDAQARQLFRDEAIAYIDAHNAAYGCFAARMERYSGGRDDR